MKQRQNGEGLMSQRTEEEKEREREGERERESHDGEGGTIVGIWFHDSLA